MALYDTTSEVKQALEEYAEFETTDLPRIRDITESLDEIEEDYESNIANLESDREELENQIDALEEQLGGPRHHSIESLAAGILECYGNSSPSCGAVLALKQDLIDLLTTKYNIPEGAI